MTFSDKLYEMLDTLNLTEEDLENAMETYREYEARAFSKITKYNQRHVS